MEDKIKTISKPHGQWEFQKREERKGERLFEEMVPEIFPERLKTIDS